MLYPIEGVQLQAPLLTSIGYTDAQSTHYFLEGTVNGAGSALNWIKEQYPKDDWWEQLPQWLAEITEPPIFINSIGNIGSPWWYTDLEPGFFNSIDNNIHNSNESHNIEHRAVAVVESILFLVLNNLDLMRESATIQQLYLSGGVSRLDGLCQKLANLSQLPVIRFEARETTAKGIAWLAHCERPVWPQRINRTFTPQKERWVSGALPDFHPLSGESRMKDFAERLMSLEKPPTFYDVFAKPHSSSSRRLWVKKA